MTGHALRGATVAEAEELGALIGAAFADDPVSRWALGPPPLITATFQLLSRHVYVPRGAGRFAGTAGGAMWLRPGGSKAVPLLAQASLAVALTRGAGPAHIARSLRVDAVMRACRPREPHFYLFAVGVLPAGRGQGLGTALITEMTDEADAAGLPCWLENTNPPNEGLYRGLGFVPVETFTPAPGCPPVTTMRRQPTGLRPPEARGA